VQCLCPEGLPVAAVQRCQLLQAAAAMLPPEVQAAHAQGILSRHHHEPLQPQLLRQALWKASMELPGAASKHWGAGAELVAFFAGGAGLEQSLQCSLPHAVTFQQFWRLLLAAGCCQPRLQDKVCAALGEGHHGPERASAAPHKCTAVAHSYWLQRAVPQVYEMSQAAAEHAWRRALLYTDAGAIISTGTDSLLSLIQGPTTLRLLPADASSAGSSQLAATFQGSAAASVGCWTAPAAGGDGRAAQPSEASVPALQEAGSRASSTPADEAGGVTDEAAAAEGTPGRGPAQAVADVGSGLCSGVSLVTPQGLMVQMRSDGCVLLAPVRSPEAQVLQSSGVSVLGAPLAAGQLDTQLMVGPFAWHAVLADGTLVKAAAAAAAAATHSAADSGVLQQCGSSSRLAILHPDGSTSAQHALQVQPQGTAIPPVAVDGWLLTTPQGEQSWTADAAALERLEADLVAAEEAAIAAAAAAEAAAAAAAVAAESPTGKKGSKGEKDRAKAISKHGGISTKRPEQPGGTADAEAASAAEGAAQAGTQLDEQAIAAIRDALAELLQQQPVSQGRIRAACLTDPDTRAVVTTREDHLLLIEYADGSKLLQVRACLI
jgi:hypothetical protein